MHFELHWVNEDAAASVFVVPPERPVTVGRNPNSDIKLRNQLTSRRHCTIKQVGSILWVRDEKSMNGTRLNQNALEPGREYRLQHGDCLHIGSCLLVVETVEQEVDTPHVVIGASR